MRTELAIEGRNVDLTLRLDPDETLGAIGQVGRPIELVTDTARVTLDTAIDPPHPDLAALATLVVVRPWVTRRLMVRDGVSAAFAAVASDVLDLEIEPIDHDLAPRHRGARTALMYSGGPDCMAADVLVGERMPLFHFVRVKHPRMPNRMTHVRGDVHESLVAEAAARGEEVHMTSSDLEYLCRPYATFPAWVSLTIGAILSGDTEHLGGIVTGRNISGMYLGWGSGFTPNGQDESAWEAVFDIAGLPLIQPLAGTTDVVSKRVAREHRLHDIARSCQLGTAQRRCTRCHKCLLTDIINAADTGQPLSELWDIGHSDHAEVLGHVTGEPPYEAQHLFAYALARIPGTERTILAEMNARLDPSIAETEWVARYYRPAIAAHIPASHRTTVEHNIAARIEFMDDDDEQRVRSWGHRA